MRYEENNGALRRALSIQTSSQSIEWETQDRYESKCQSGSQGDTGHPVLEREKNYRSPCTLVSRNSLIPSHGEHEHSKCVNPHPATHSKRQRQRSTEPHRGGIEAIPATTATATTAGAARRTGRLDEELGPLGEDCRTEVRPSSPASPVPSSLFLFSLRRRSGTLSRSGGRTSTDHCPAWADALLMPRTWCHLRGTSS